MRTAIMVFAVVVLSLAAKAQFRGYFDISQVTIPELQQPDWRRKIDDNRLLYICVNLQRCALPTVIEIKGVLREEKLPMAFLSGELTPAKLLEECHANASRIGDDHKPRCLTCEAFESKGFTGVHMESSADLEGQVYFVKRWIGEGNRMLEVKVTARDLTLTRQLGDTAVRAILPQVFTKQKPQ